MTKLPPNFFDSDSDALLAIQLLDGTEWSSDTLEAVAAIMTDAGYTIRDMSEMPDYTLTELRA